jgi:hypothetical protein
VVIDHQQADAVHGLDSVAGSGAAHIGQVREISLMQMT